MEGHSLDQTTPRIATMIIVGIDNSAEHRLDEYSPWKTEFQTSDGTGYFGGLGRAYVDWLVDTVKPFIDKKYRTLPQRETTLLAGSSNGGLYHSLCRFTVP